MKKQEKVQLVDLLAPKLKEATSLVFVNYKGLSVSLQQELKSKLKEVDADITVIKNTLIKRAVEKASLPLELTDDSILSGQTAVVISNSDSIAAIQVLGKFAKEKNIPEFKIGVVEGNLQDKDALVKISTLPGKDQLFAQVVGSLMSPMYGLTGTLQGNLQKLVYILKEVSTRG